MDISELEKAIKSLCFLKGSLKNSSIDANNLRGILKSSLKNDQYGYYSGFESHWELLCELSHHDILVRERKDLNPLETFLYFVDSGFYPPPEVLMIVADCFNRYISSGGKTDLNKAFFENYQKKKLLVDVDKFKKYWEFHSNWVPNKSGSLQCVAEKYLLSKIEATDSEFKESIDVESFLRGYRRWKKDMNDGKYIQFD